MVQRSWMQQCSQRSLVRCVRALVVTGDRRPAKGDGLTTSAFSLRSSRFSSSVPVKVRSAMLARLSLSV